MAETELRPTPRSRPRAGPAPPGGPEMPAAARRGDPPDLSPLRPAVVGVGEKYGYDAAHAQHVARLAGALFAALPAVHGLAPAWGVPLEHAGLLHDIGYFVQARGHHRHSRYLIRHDALLDDYPAPWREFIALLCRNHRRRFRSAPRRWTRACRAALPALAAMLRLADGLDYGHDGMARLQAARLRRGRLEIAVDGVGLAALRAVLRRKAALAVQTFGVPVTFTQATPW